MLAMTDMFQAWDAAASCFFSVSEVRIEPVVISSLSMKLSSPTRIVLTLHAGFHEPVPKRKDTFSLQCPIASDEPS